LPSIDFIPAIYLAAAAIALGFVGLIWSADRFVAGSAAIALNFGLSPMIVGLTVVSFGTSAPEVLVSLQASLANSGEIAIGNALGSNIANIGLVLAVTALIATIPIQKHILFDELPVLIGVTLVSGWFLYDAHLSRTEGWILAALLIPVMGYMIWAKRGSPENADGGEDIQKMSNLSACLLFLVGLVLLILSSKILVWGAQTTATHFGVSPLIIGLTVIAIGTSLPELAASITSALKGHHDIALGNIIGSNIFNFLAVMSIAGIVQPLSYSESVFARDFGTTAGLTLLLTLCIAVAFVSGNKRGPGIGRITGAMLLLCYAGYMYVISTSLT
jgi:cation:H+ antiporter